MKSNPLLHKSRVKSHIKMMLPLHNLGLCGTKPLAIIMMLLLGSTMMEIQVCLLIQTCSFSIFVVCAKVSAVYIALIFISSDLCKSAKFIKKCF